MPLGNGIRIWPSGLFVLMCIFAGCSNQPTEHPYKVKSLYGVSDPQFYRTMNSLLGPPLVAGNHVQTLVNGDQIFPPMLDAIHSAQRTICFETFVYWSGELGSQFASALAERAAHGVKVHVVIDSVGSDRIDRRYVKEMTDAGVELVRYHPLEWYNLTNAEKLKNRTHRKLLVIDGKVGFIGGAGIADEWLGNAGDPQHWRDTHYVVRGPVVAQLQATFIDNWMEATGNVLQGDDYFPTLDGSGEVKAQVFKSSPREGSESMELMYLLCIASAQNNIRLASPYFVPNRLTTEYLVGARERGVRVQIIVPGDKIDIDVVRHASRARWGELLKAGVEIFEYQPTMFHCKQMIIDDLWTSIGSANLDNLSFRLNDEANLNVFDAEFALEQIRIFDDDVNCSKRITYETWRERPFGEKVWDGIATTFGWLM